VSHTVPALKVGPRTCDLHHQDASGIQTTPHNTSEVLMSLRRMMGKQPCDQVAARRGGACCVCVLARRCMLWVCVFLKACCRSLLVYTCTGMVAGCVNIECVFLKACCRCMLVYTSTGKVVGCANTEDVGREAKSHHRGDPREDLPPEGGGAPAHGHQAGQARATDDPYPLCCGR